MMRPPGGSLAPPPPAATVAAHRHNLRFAIVMVAALALLAAGLLWRGASFYALSLDTRVDHEDFRVLSPGSSIGHGYGVVGTLLILTNLLYLVRRRIARARLGSMRLWLDMHVFTGLFGSVLVLFHSAFQLRTPVATLTAVALGFVVGSGLIGRYFYGLAPQASTSGLSEKLDWLDALQAGLGRRIAEGLRALPAPEPPARPGLVPSLARIPRWRAQARERRALVMSAAAALCADPALDRAERAYVRKAVRETAQMATAPVRTLAGESLLRSWRGLHRFMALLMIVSVSVHIAVAWLFGFRWIFSE